MGEIWRWRLRRYLLARWLEDGGGRGGPDLRDDLLGTRPERESEHHAVGRRYLTGGPTEPTAEPTEPTVTPTGPVVKRGLTSTTDPTAKRRGPSLLE
jgi:hypothetical protein